MIISLKGFISSYTKVSARRGAMGQAKQKLTQWKYDKSVMWVILGFGIAVACLSLVALALGLVKENYTSFGFSLVLFGVAQYLLIATVKEKANLDLLTIHFENLSESARNEILTTLAVQNAGASKGLLEFIETIFKRG